jgi:type I restriction enzyme, S subunit
MSFPRYPKYKASRVEWLGEVPEHWNRTRIKRTARSGNKTFVDGDWIETPYITTEGVRLLQCGNVGTGVFEEQGFRYVSEETFSHFDCTEVEPNNVLICRLQSSRTILAGRACLAPQLGVKMITSVDNCIVKTSAYFDPQYIVYQLSTLEYLSFVEVVARGGTRDRVSRSMLGNIDIVAPPLPEQKAIAEFLDRETGKIDELVAEQRRLMELLKEKRQAVISHAVTKGLNPHARMKPSGIEWLGDVPEAWTVTVIKRFSTLQRGHDLTDAQRTEGPYPVVTSGGLSGTHGAFMARGPGVVTGRYGSTGRLFYINDDFWPHNTALYVSDFHGNSPRFVWYSLQTLDFAAHSAKAAVPGIDRNDIHVLPVAVPPTGEQIAIVEFLDSELAKFDTLTAEAQRAIDLLQERRIALISAAVTGQIDVRDHFNTGGSAS